MCRWSEDKIDELNEDIDTLREELGEANRLVATYREAVVDADALREALQEINSTIYAAGAPLGSDNYFEIRGVCCKHLYGT